MIFVKHENKEPIDGCSYLVSCPEYSTSGFAISKWNGEDKIWIDEGHGILLHRYVESYFPTPLNNVEIEILHT